MLSSSPLLLFMVGIPNIQLLLMLSCFLGTLTRYHLHPAEWLHRLPDSLSFEEGSLCEPLAVALAGVERAGLRLGDPTLIWCVCIRDFMLRPIIYWLSVALDRSVSFRFFQHVLQAPSPL